MKYKTLYCDLTQSWSATGGGIGTYIRHKRRYITRDHDAAHLLIIPGPEDRVSQEGNLITVEIASPMVLGSNHYRFMYRNGAVKIILAKYQPDFIECLDPYNLPWAALSHAKKHPETTLIAGYRTDFPNAHFAEWGNKRIGKAAGKLFRVIAQKYAAILYRRFDAVYALDSKMQAHLHEMNIDKVHCLPLGVNLDQFDPAKRSEPLRAELGVAPDAPLLIYAGRLDQEKRANMVVDAFLGLPDDLGAHLIMLGEGPHKQPLAERTKDANVHLPGYITDRVQLARIFASSDIYVSAMPFETFGISVIEAQASGLPIIGVNGGAMPDRVPQGTGLLGPVDDVEAMRDNIIKMWQGNPSEMGQLGRDYVIDNFSWDRTFDNLFNTIYPDAQGKAGHAHGAKSMLTRAS